MLYSCEKGALAMGGICRFTRNGIASKGEKEWRVRGELGVGGAYIMQKDTRGKIKETVWRNKRDRIRKIQKG